MMISPFLGGILQTIQRIEKIIEFIISVMNLKKINANKNPNNLPDTVDK